MQHRNFFKAVDCVFIDSCSFVEHCVTAGMDVPHSFIYFTSFSFFLFFFLLFLFPSFSVFFYTSVFFVLGGFFLISFFLLFFYFSFCIIHFNFLFSSPFFFSPSPFSFLFLLLPVHFFSPSSCSFFFISPSSSSLHSNSFAHSQLQTLLLSFPTSLLWSSLSIPRCEYNIKHSEEKKYIHVSFSQV